MKSVRKITTAILSLAITLGLFAAPATEVQAAEKAAVTKAVHLYVGTVEDDAIDVSFAEKGDHIGNLKTSSKNLKAKIVNINTNMYADNTAAAKIGLYAAAKGNYTVSFDILDSDDEKVSSHSVKIYANTDMAIKSVTFAGGPTHKITDKTKGKLSVTMNKGYTFKKIVVETYDKEGKQKSKTVKNNSVITLGKYAYRSEKGEVYGDYYFMDTSLMAYTRIYVYYTDKYTKSDAKEIYYMYRVAQ